MADDLRFTAKHPRYLGDTYRRIAAFSSSDPVEVLGVEEIAKIVPPLPGHRSGERGADYSRWVRRGYYAPLLGRLVSGMSSVVCAWAPSITAGGIRERDWDAFLANVNRSGADLETFMVNLVVPEAVRSGRGGLLLEFPDIPEGTSLADSESSLPWWTWWDAEEIVNWRWVRRDTGEDRLALLVLRTSVELEDREDPYKHVEAFDWRIYTLSDPRGDEPEVELRRVYTDRSAKKVIADEGLSVVLLGGRPLQEIPFDILGLPDPEPPPLDDAVRVATAIFANSVLRENALVAVGSPTPWVTGYDPAREMPGSVDNPSEIEWKMGSTQVLAIINADAKVGLLEASDASLGAISKAIEEKREDFAVVGGRLLISRDKMVAEAARTEEIRRQGDRSIIAGVALRIRSLLESAVGRVAQLWWDVKWDGEVKVNPMTESLDPQVAMALAEMFVQRHVGRQEVRNFLRRAGVIDPDRTDEDLDAELGLGGDEILPPPPAPPAPDEDEDGDDVQ